MPNYQTDVLLASAGDVLTQLMTVLDTYLTARGWTVNLFGDYRQKYAGDDYVGKRIHAQKTIDGTARFINLRSFKNQRIYQSSLFKQETGIGAMASTAYDGATHLVSLTSVSDIGGGTIRFSAAGLYAATGDTVTVAGTTNYNGAHTVIAADDSNGAWVEVTATYVSSQSGTITGPSRWDSMTGGTGRTNINDIATGSAGGGASDLPADVLSYFLFSENSGDNIYLICGNSTGYTGICFGTTSTGNFFMAGSGIMVSGPDIDHNAILMRRSTYGNIALRKKDDSEWFPWPAINTVGSPILVAIEDTNTNILASYNAAQQLLFCSPDNFKGNNPLIPTHTAIASGSSGSGDQIFTGVVPGIKFVNMKLMDSLTELTFGGDVYKLFRVYAEDDVEDATVGVALLK